jgi:hypothetical protein
MAANHEIHVNLEKDSHGSHAIPQNIPRVIHVGDTVQYTSTAGEVTMKFDKKDLTDKSERKSPFDDASGKEKNSVSSSDGPTKASHEGVYFGKCSLKPHGQQTSLGWGEGSLLSGVTHVVKNA